MVNWQHQHSCKRINKKKFHPVAIRRGEEAQLKRCWEPGFQAWAQSTCPELSAQARVATREERGVLGFPSRRGLTPRGSLECNPEIPAFPGEDN